MARLFIPTPAPEAPYIARPAVTTRTPGRHYCAEDRCPVWVTDTVYCRRHSAA